jgi:hypothetical protein
MFRISPAGISDWRAKGLVSVMGSSTDAIDLVERPETGAVAMNNVLGQTLWPIRTVLALLFVISCASLGSSAYLWNRLQALDSGQNEVDERVALVESSYISAFDFEGVEIALDATSSNVASVKTEVSDIQYKIGQLVDCVNSYMDVVADSRGGQYWYYNCRK